MYPRIVRHSTAAAMCIAAVAALFFYAAQMHTEEKRREATEVFVAAINVRGSFTEHANAYRALLETIGPDAQDILLANLPATPRTHMINHESGYFLYRTYNDAGLRLCKNYFNGGCYHGFVEEALVERGIGAIDDVVNACKGDRTLAQARECTHGAGHAILIAEGYEHLDKAAKRCRQLFPESDVAIEDCNDGVFMENNFGGFSIPPENRWFKEYDPLYPCNDPRIETDAIAKRACLFLQMQSTLQVAKYPTLHGDISTVVQFCTEQSSALEQDMCFLGLARQIQARHVEDVSAIATSCALFPAERSPQCMAHAAESAYAFGSPTTSIALCMQSGIEPTCFAGIYARIGSTAERTLSGKKRACAALPAPYATACKEAVLVN